MRILPSLALVLTGGLFVFASTTGANAPDRPPGVDADHWVSLNTSTGVVLTSGEEEIQDESADTGKQDKFEPHVLEKFALYAPEKPFVEAALKHAEAKEPVHGYLMVKQDGTWRRLLITR